MPNVCNFVIIFYSLIIITLKAKENREKKYYKIKLCVVKLSYCGHLVTKCDTTVYNKEDCVAQYSTLILYYNLCTIM